MYVHHIPKVPRDADHGKAGLLQAVRVATGHRDVSKRVREVIKILFLTRSARSIILGSCRTPWHLVIECLVG